MCAGMPGWNISGQVGAGYSPMRLPNAGRRHVRSMIDIDPHIVYCRPSPYDIGAHGYVAGASNNDPRVTSEVIAGRTQDYIGEMKKQLLCRLERSTPIPGEDIINVNLADPSITVQPEFLAFQLTESSEFAEPSYKLCAKKQFVEILVKGVCSSQTVDVDDTFLKQPDRKKCSLVFISAGGGLGKSTQLMKMTLDWHNNKSDILSAYELVLYVPISSISHQSHALVDIILETEVFSKHYPFKPDEPNRIAHFLDGYQNSDKVLIILDGYGKEASNNRVIKGIINGEHGYFPRSTVVVAGRPFWMKNLNGTRTADMKVDIAGITDESVPKLFTNILKSDELATELHDICKQFFFDTTILRTPLFALLTCYIFHAHKAKDITVCQHKMPTTVTELFNTILRVFLMIMHRKVSFENEAMNVAFEKSPLLDIDTAMPPHVRRFILAVAEMSYHGLQTGKYIFGKHEFDAVLLEPAEVCAFGLLVCVSDTQLCEHTNREIRNRDDFRFQFRNTMFQEYMAALYISKNLSTLDEILLICQENRHKKKMSGDTGYDSLGSIGSVEFKPPKPPPKCLMQRLRRMFTPRNRSSKTKNQFQPTFNPRVATEHSTDASNVCPEMKTQSCHNLAMIHRRRNVPEQHDETRSCDYSDEPETPKCLYDMLNPFQTCCMFACGMNPKFTRKLLETFGEHVQAKVCQNNTDKFDVGFEAALYCESFDKSLIGNFYEYFKNLRGRVGTDIQFPTPYDELVTSQLAFSLSNEQVLYLLLHWYRLDLEESQYGPLKGGNVVRSGTTFLEMSDPCLFEVYMLHRYTFENITELIITGNYFPNFNHISKSFPSLQLLKFDSVNVPSMKQFRSLEKDSGSVNQSAHGCANLKEIVIRNCRASFPLNEHLLKFLQLSGKSLKSLQLLGLRFGGEENIASVCNSLCDVITRFVTLDTIHIRNSGLGNADSMVILASALSRFRSLRDLDLSENDIGIYLPELLHALSHTDNCLEALELSQCRIKPQTFQHISDKLPQFHSLVHLGISANQVGSSGVAIINRLKWCRRLRSLDLHRCALQPQHFKNIAFYVTQLEALHNLDISDNSLAHETRQFLVCLPKCLRTINLRRCGITVSLHCSGITEILSNLSHLQSLDVQDNDLQGNLHDIIRGLQESPVEYLNVRKCRLRPNDFLLAAPILPKLRHLSEFVIGFNTMCRDNDDSRERLVKHLRGVKTLKKVVSCRMYGEHFTDSQMRKLSDNGRVQVVNFRHK